MKQMTDMKPINFRTIAQRGLGKEACTLAHALIWYNDWLYLGATTPRGSSAEDAARILRYKPSEDLWETVFESAGRATDPDAVARHNARTAEYGIKTTPESLADAFGVRSFVTFQGKSDPHPCLYAGTMSVFGGEILRSEDGLEFDAVVSAGLHDDTILSFRGLTSFKGRLFTAPAGTTSPEWADLNFAPEAMVYCSDDPAAGPDSWQAACTPAFDDPTNEAVFALGAAHGYLYAGTASAKRGFQLWRTDGEGDAPFKWERVMIDGAGRFNHNHSVATLQEFNGDMYVGGGIPGLGEDRENDVGPAAAELLVIRQDGSWDIVFGEPRCTPEGLKIPLSAMGPGCDDPYNSVIWSMEEHDGALYVGTHHWGPFDYALNARGEPLRGGYQVWRSADGQTWERVINDALGHVSHTGLRSMESTPEGLFLGTTVHAKLLQFLSRNTDAVKAQLATEPNGFTVLRGE